MVAAAIEVPDGKKGFGRLRLAHLENAGATQLTDFVTSHVKNGAHVVTDAWTGYRKLTQNGYQHQVINLRSTAHKAHHHFPGVHRAFSLFKRFRLGTYQGAASRKHLQRYATEFEFRFNRRNSKNRALLFQRLLSAAVRDRGLSAEEINVGTFKGWPASRWVT